VIVAQPALVFAILGGCDETFKKPYGRVRVVLRSMITENFENR
jgi:hypothetical protein